MTRFPVHPFTGLTAIGFRRDGRPIYPIRGGSEPAPAPGAPAPTPGPTPSPAPSPAPDPAKDEPLGAPGLKALQTERAAREALEKQLAELAPLKDLAAALAGGQTPPPGKSAVDLLSERFAAHEQALDAERQARWRAEIAQEKGLTAQQAARLVGGTRDELAADADALTALFPTAPAGPRIPVPDPSQGARGGQPGPDLQAQIDAAKANGDFWGAAALERSKLQNIPRPR